MNVLDSIKQKEFPTIMVPQHEELTPCAMGKTRLLIGCNGLYLETMQPWGRLVKQMWQSDRSLPYGEVEEIDEFYQVVDSMWPIVESSVLPEAAKYARNNKEWAGGWITHTPDGLKYLPLEFSATGVSADYHLPKLPENQSYVVDIHSHGKIEPFFSPTDDEDDRGFVRIRIVIGGYEYLANKDMDSFKYKIRYTVEGFFFDYEEGESDED